MSRDTLKLSLVDTEGDAAALLRHSVPERNFPFGDIAKDIKQCVQRALRRPCASDAGSLEPVAFAVLTNKWRSPPALAHHECRHAAIIRTPFLKACAVEPVLSAQLRHCHPAFGLARHRHDLRFGKSGPAHSNLLSSRYEKILLPHRLNQGEDYREASTSRRVRCAVGCGT